MKNKLKEKIEIDNKDLPNIFWNKFSSQHDTVETNSQIFNIFSKKYVMGLSLILVIGFSFYNYKIQYKDNLDIESYLLLSDQINNDLLSYSEPIE